MLDFVGLFIIIVGYIIGLGAVTVIDLHGFLGRKSSYWTEATTRTHKVTKPLIWIGIILVTVGELIFLKYFSFVFLVLMIFNLLLILNGLFLSFYVSPFLLKREKEDRAKELLPKSLQYKIIISFIFSLIGWWGSLALLIFSVLSS